MGQYLKVCVQMRWAAGQPFPSPSFSVTLSPGVSISAHPMSLSSSIQAAVTRTLPQWQPPVQVSRPLANRGQHASFYDNGGMKWWPPHGGGDGGLEFNASGFIKYFVVMSKSSLPRINGTTCIFDSTIM